MILVHLDGRGGGGLEGQKEDKQLKEIVGLVGESSEVLARMVGEGVLCYQDISI